ncbi:MAG: DUF4886 domain-containing protein, partial [Pseudomonadota bacterium]
MEKSLYAAAVLISVLAGGLFGYSQSTGSDTQPVRVLFVGNSLTFQNDMPSLVSKLAGSKGIFVVHDTVAAGGAKLSDHASNPKLADKIRETNWDFVVFQEQSQMPGFPEIQLEAEVYPFAKELADTVRSLAPGAKTVFYMTMAHKKGDQNNSTNIPEVSTYAGMQDRVNDTYVTLARRNRAKLAPVGRVWAEARSAYPELELY